jgi:hypothetical protein
MSRNFPTSLAALGHRAKGQCLFEGRTLNNNNNNNNNITENVSLPGDSVTTIRHNTQMHIFHNKGNSRTQHRKV